MHIYNLMLNAQNNMIIHVIVFLVCDFIQVCVYTPQITTVTLRTATFVLGTFRYLRVFIWCMRTGKALLRLQADPSLVMSNVLCMCLGSADLTFIIRELIRSTSVHRNRPHKFKYNNPPNSN